MLAVYRNPLVSATMASTFFLKIVAFLCIPFMTIFLSKSGDLPPYVIGLMVGLYQLGSVFAGFYSGMLSDKIGRRLVLLMGLYGGALIFLLFFLLATFMKGSPAFAVLFGVLNVLFGISSAFFWPVSQALLADYLPKEGRAMVFRHRYVLNNFGMGLGPPLGAFLGVASDRAAFVLSGACYLVFATLYWFVTRGKGFSSSAQAPGVERNLIQSIKILGSDRAFRYLTVSMFFFLVAFAQIDTNFSRIVTEKFEDGVTFFALLLAINAISIFSFQPVVTALSKRLNTRQTIQLGILMFSVVCMLFPIHDYGKPGLIVLIVLISFAEVLVVPIASVVVDELAPPEMRGTYFGGATLRNVGVAAGPAVGGVVLATFGHNMLFVFMGLCAVVALAVFFLSFKENKSAHSHSPS